ncbi:DASS family sodium-coupled anion symporter [Anaeromyxobacter diazotrophicus]|uniref:2-oxoglutarate translocator n=1 Tax=Anaeromyxobacter diazotrophicus TaxID=2590199 RepID=A0A7I9VL66_9BACT|nr:DASS family sodium-coupled anion symporter [Anaeromyxobacter diazotrophicus]GEJ57152.1 2-oxoglutarate translocator [Anaeromyxobacter diazotrophicus]
MPSLVVESLPSRAAPPPAPPAWWRRRGARLALPAALAASCFVLPAPAGLTGPAWRLLGIFVATVLLILLNALPEPSAVLLGVTAAALTAVPLKAVLAGYADSTFWLIITAVMMSVGFRKSGLAGRVGLLLLRAFGRTPLGLAYVFGALDLLLATSIPAAPARTGGLVYPLARGVLDVTEAKGGEGGRRLGAYLTVSLYMLSMVTGSLFLTGMAPNVLNASLAAKILGVQLTWPLWTLAAAPGFLLFLGLPVLVSRLAPPGVLPVAAARERSRAALAALGPMKPREWIVAATFSLALGLWATSSLTGVNIAVVAFAGVSVLLVTHVIEWKDLADSKETWSALVWFGGILGLASALDGTGFFKWLTAAIQGCLPPGRMGTGAAFLLIALLATLPHYLFPSLVAYVATFSPVVFSFIAATGAPRYPAALLACFLMTISSTLTHYGNGLGPMLFDTGYVGKATWWKVGLAVTALAAALYLAVGLPYWRLVGLYR